jgi:protein KRI1
MAPKDKTILFDDNSEDESDGGAQIKVNDEYAKRFEYNKKREERHRLEEKFGKGAKEGEDDEDSSDDETEDEDGYLATEELDAQLNATLEALRKKDPRIYDPKATFYSPIDDNAAAAEPKEKKDKPVTLRDYHRERYLAGDTGADEEEEKPHTYAQEQNSLKNSILGEIKAQLNDEEEEEEEDEDFLKPKAGEKERIKSELKSELADGVHPSRAGNVKAGKGKGKAAKTLTAQDVANADKDPQLYLSNFMAARAWIEPEKNNWQAFDSDEEEDDKADDWEAAYNLRFEDPSKSNEVLKSYARDVAAAKSVRREEKTGRKKKREEEREQKEAEKQERREQRNRLRNLKIEEAESKLKQIKKAAGLAGKEVDEDEWMKLIDGAWDNDKWEQEMAAKFGDEYYAEGDEVASDDEGQKKHKVKKPKWDDDIDIKDLVPDFEDEERPDAALSDAEEVGEGEDAEEDEDDEDGPSRKRQKTTKDRKREKLASQKEARKERSKIEALVDAKMDIDEPLAGSSSSKSQGPKFAYRETWAESYGLTAKDILMAPSDAALNEYVGLKKLAHFRPADKKAKDKKRLSKKARLRQWRKDIFGPDAEREGPAFVFGGGERGDEGKSAPNEESNIIEGKSKKRKKRSGRGKASE